MNPASSRRREKIFSCELQNATRTSLLTSWQMVFLSCTVLKMISLTLKSTLTVLYDFIYFSVMKTTKSNAKNNTEHLFCT